MHARLKNAYQHVNKHGLHVRYPDDLACQVWNNVHASLAHHGDLKKSDFMCLPCVDPNSGEVYPRDIRTVAFYVGDELYAMHATPMCTDENVLTGEVRTFLFNASAPACLGSIAETFYRVLSAAETERRFITRMHNLSWQNHLPDYIRLRAIDLVEISSGALDRYMTVNQRLMGARSTLAQYHPRIMGEQPEGWCRDLVPVEFHTKLGM